MKTAVQIERMIQDCNDNQLADLYQHARTEKASRPNDKPTHIVYQMIRTEVATRRARRIWPVR